ncbi:hypothetical protein IHE45_06G035500 [Dioscorea alata]|uniref:Uncharacterized protein n=1 Tax=Dioscorea alata TaxID=55571 RepID=A0ACB7VWX8_DIOAL|nr:hypothetical protein IHE45_06G035500 [Dioscorea alata]
MLTTSDRHWWFLVEYTRLYCIDGKNWRSGLTVCLLHRCMVCNIFLTVPYKNIFLCTSCISSTFLFARMLYHSAYVLHPHLLLEENLGKFVFLRFFFCACVKSLLTSFLI